MQASREAWQQLVKDSQTVVTVAVCNKYYKVGDTKNYDASKRRLPLACYMCTFDESTGSDPKKPKPMGHWRNQKAARLNGLIMHDFDKLSKKGIDVKELWAAIPSHWFDDNTCANAILLAHVTPSGDGLRLVTIANPDMDIEQNQQMILSRIKAIHPDKFDALETDESCINADRGSFVVDANSILFINERLFDYDNPAYDEKFGEKYRTGHVSGRAKSANRGNAARKVAGAASIPAADKAAQRSNAQGGASSEGRGVDNGLETVAKTTDYPDTYHDVQYATILDAWFEQNGGEPQQGDRHKVMLRLIADLRYICDNNDGFIKHVLLQREFIRKWVDEDGAGTELDNMISSSTGKELWWGTPKRLKAALDTVGVKMETRKKPGCMSDDEEKKIFESFGDRLTPLLAGPYVPVSQIVSKANLLPAIFTSGTMFCTLMTRCWYEHYDGRDTRMNPTAIVIGPPASGKSFAEKLDDPIMAVMRNADAPGRKAEREYKRKKVERATSSKAQKGEALEKPEVMIRYLPSKTSNAIFYQRSVNAKEVIDGEIFYLHLYMFDSELDSAVGAQKGDWAGKHDLELKAFHNEFSGVDYANNDSVNEVIQVFWNQVITGTPVSLQKKFTMRNINDGFCTRVAISKMWPEKYRMIGRGNRTVNHEVECSLKEWGYRFDTMKGEMKLQKLVDHVYNLCEHYACSMQAESSSSY